MSALRKVSVELPDAFAELFTPSRYKAFWGGRGGAKSRSFGRALLIRSLRQPLRILCAREVQKSIKDSVKRLLDDDIDRMGLGGSLDKGAFFESTETEIRSRIGGLFIFAGLKTNVDTVKSTEGIDICWCEEANTLSQHSINTLIPTIRKDGSEIWFSWNPDQESDPVDKMFRGGHPPPDSIVRKVTFEDNPWFPSVLRKELEWDRSRDPEKYAHIWLGDYIKNSEARVFRNWKIDSFDVPKGARPYYGGDWGFAIDPNVLLKAYIIGRILYIEDEAYEVGCPIDKTPFLFGGCTDPYIIEKNEQAYKALTADEKKRWQGIEGARKWPITSDSARPETINYMQTHGFPHIQAARKGPGSIEEGVEFLKSFDIIIHPRCKHAIDEFTTYSFKVDKLTGEVLPALEDKKNNVIDAARYLSEQVRAFDGGTVYATPETDIVVDAEFKLPRFWPRVWALDIDGAKASILWAAHDRENDTIYVYGELVTQRHELALVCDAIKTRNRAFGDMPGLFDHRARKRTEQEGQRVIDTLLDILRTDQLFTPHIEAEAAIPEVTRRLSTKRIKVLQSCPQWLAQYRSYRRNKDGDIVEESDGLMRAMDLLVMEGAGTAMLDDASVAEAKDEWAGKTRSPVTGY